MASVSFSGVGSGIDFDTVRDAILTQRAVPINKMQTKVSLYTSRSEGLKQLNTALAALTTATEELKSRDLGTGRSVNSGDGTVATATASNSVALGNIDLSVTRLATTLTQASRSYSAKNAEVLTGGATEATFELRTGGASTGVEIKIDSNNNTLEGLRNAINAANAGVTATIVDLKGDGTGNQIVLSSKATGATGRVELVETSATGTGADLNLRSVNPPDGDFAKLDAEFSVSGLTMTRSSNTVSDAVDGVTFSLRKAGSTALTVTQSGDVENKLRAFVTAYNSVQSLISAQYKKDSTGRPTGILAGEATLRNIQQQLRDAVGTISDTNGGVFNSLSQIGISTKSTGELEFDSAVYSEKLKNNSDDIRALLFGKTTADSGIFQSFANVSKGLSDSVTGSVAAAITGYENSIKSLNDTITKRSENLAVLKASLTKRFSAADAAIGLLNSQQSSISNIVKSLSSKDD
jgi:flagellar hook-associated protein 2